MLINEKHLAELNSPIQKINSRVELHNGSTLEKICTCNDYVSHFTIERVGEGKFFGYGICHKLNITFIDPNRDLNLTNIDNLEVTFGVDGDFIYPFPVFYITSEINRDETTNEISLTAYDALYEAANHKTSELNILQYQGSYTLETFAAACAALLGMPMKIVGVEDNAFDMVINNNINFDGSETIRDALNAIAEATQTIYYMSGNWELTFKRLDKTGNPVLTIDKTKYIDLKSGVNNTLTNIEFLTELGNNVAAGLKMTASGDVVSLEDVSDINHSIVTTINSKNLIKYPYMETLPITREGITFTANGYGGISMTGTATGFAVFRLCDGSFLKAGQSYLLSKPLTVGGVGDGVALHIAYYNENNEVKYFSSSPMVWSDKYKFQQCYIQVKPGTVCNGETIYPAINIGSGYKYAEFTPYVDVSSVEVRSYGKNLISYPYKEKTKTVNGITYMDNGDGSITINGTATADYISFIFGYSLPLEDGVTYQLSGCNGKLIIKYYNEAGVASWVTGLITWRKEYVLETVYVQVNTGETFNNVTWYPMVREANTDAEYEPYEGAIGAVAADDTVTGLTSISPYMTIACSNKNAEVHIEYYRKQSNGSTQYIRNNPFYELRSDIATLSEKALAAVYGLTINPFECDWLGNYLVEIGDKIALTTENDNEIITYMVDDSITFDGTLGQTSKWEYVQDEAETASNPSSLGEVINQTIATVDKVNREIELRVTYEEMESAIKVSEDSISAKVEKETSARQEDKQTLEKRITEVASLQLQSNKALLEFKTEIEEHGVEKVQTITGYSFSDEGLNISKSDKDINTTINHEGMKVYRGTEEALTANNDGVNAYNLTATTYLTIGTSSRFENYDKDGEMRTACFWVGN